MGGRGGGLRPGGGSLGPAGSKGEERRGRRAEEEVSDLPAGTEMLPLIVGQIAKAAPEIEDAVVADAEIAEVPDGGVEEPADPDSAERQSSANADAPPADYAVDEDTYSDENAVVKKDVT